MKIIKLDQREDREAWLEFRRGKISGTKAKPVKPLSRGVDRTPTGFWRLVAERLAIAKDGEPDIDRGQRLEQEAVRATAKKHKLKFAKDKGVWVSDDSEYIMLSPDAYEDSDKPSYACEAKCLDSHNHIKTIVMDLQAKKSPEYNPFYSVPKDNQDQVLQYYVVNEHLNKLYLSLLDDRLAYEGMVHYEIVIERKHVAHLLDATKEQQGETLRQVEQTIKMLVKELGK